MPTFNTRIQNKIDSYSNWITNNPTPLNGEICIVTVPAATGAVKQEPAVLIKVGNGTDDFKTLPFIGAKAADVSSWALADNKPEYTAEEITGLADYISGEIQDTNTEYTFSLTNNVITIQKKDVNGEYADYQTIDLTTAFNAKADKVANATAGNFAGVDANGNLTDSGKKAADFATAAQGALADSALQKADITAGSANGTIAVEGTDVAVTGLGSAAFTEAGAYATADHNHNAVYAAKAATETHIANGDIHVTTSDKSAWNTAAEKAGANEAAITAIKDGAEIDSFSDVETALAGKQAVGDYATKTEAQGYADAKDEAIAAAKKAGDDAQADVDALETYVGTIPETATATNIVAYVQEKTAGIATDTALEELTGRVATAEGAIDAIEADYLKAADKTELSDAIGAEKTRAEGIEAGLESRLAAVEGDYLKAADKTELQGNIDTVNAAVERLTNGVSADEVDGVNDLIQYVKDHGTEVTGMQEDIADNAEAIAAEAERAMGEEAKNAQAAADAKAAVEAEVERATGVEGGLDTRIKALEGAVGESGSVATDIADAKQEAIDAAAGDATTKANAAEAAAKGHADDLNTAMNTRVEALEAIDHEHANKDLLDTYTQTEADLADAVAKKHEHANADVLAGITAEKVTAWDAAQANVLENVAGVEGAITDKTFTVTGISTDLLKQGSEVIIFCCGTSAPDGGPALISFKIDTTSYQAEPGMTWEQWAASDYNVDGVNASNWGVTLDGESVCTENNNSNTKVTYTDTIVSGGTYYWVAD